MPKKSGELRICVDYRKVNAATCKNAWPLPRIEDCLNSLSGAKYFCTLDLAQGYHQVPLAEKDKEKTAFSTRTGLKQYTCMPFGLTNSPATFQKLMESILGGLQWNRIVLYLDDVIVYGETFEKTLENLAEVFNRLKEADLKLKPSKCNLFQKQVEFLGHSVSEQGISCDPKKIEAVAEWPQPKTIKEVRSFVGFAQYYRKFIRNFSNIAAPLNSLTKHRAKFIWSEECNIAFNMLKEKLTKAPVLAYPNNEGKFILDTDASLYGVGGVLSQIQNGEEKVIAYGSKTLSSSQQNYCTTMRELLAVVIFIQQFHSFLWGRDFTLRTDHASLQWLCNFKEMSGMLARWMSVLGNYSFTIEHRKGNIHLNADGLSRIPPKRCKNLECSDCSMDKEACICVITARKAQDKDHKDMSICGAQIQELPELVSTCVIIKGQAQDKDHKV